MVWICFFTLSGLRASAQFTVSNSGPLTIESGHYGSLTVTVTPTGNLSETVLINCVNLPANAECFFPNNISGLTINNAAASMTLIVNTSTIYKYESRTKAPHPGLERVAVCSLFAPALCLLLPGRRRFFRAPPALRMMVCAAALLPLAGLAGCASTRPSVTPPGNYVIGVTASYSSYTASSTVNLTVTP